MSRDEFLSDLIINIDKIHTTPMSEERIKQNLNLQTDDVVTWCKNALKTRTLSSVYADLALGAKGQSRRAILSAARI